MDNVIVTGASRGLGLAIAQRLAGAGYDVIALARTLGEPLTAAIDAAGGRIRFAPFDLSNIEGIAELVRGMKAEHGPIWGLVNNAGLGLDGLLANTHNKQIEDVVALNVTAPWVIASTSSRYGWSVLSSVRTC